MCGISGFFGTFEPSLLKIMNHCQSHRGLDDSGILLNKNYGVGLAHRRLSILDLSPLGHQPMWDSTEQVVIVFNGEIYNYKKIKNQLINNGYNFRNNTDTEVLLNLYLHNRETMLRKLNGMFAFAIWDTRSNSLFLARDGIGVKPLYYTTTYRGFIFASELKALLQAETVERSLNIEAIYYYLTYLWCPANQTIIENIKKLEPGHALIVKDGKVQKHWQFYDLPYHQTIEPLSEDEAIQQVRRQLQESVQRQMVADVPVGAFLSGGLDSSSVVAFAKQHTSEQKLQCFTIGLKNADSGSEGFVEDLPYAQKVANHLDVALHTIYVGSDMADHLEKMLYHLDEPQADPAPLNALFISQLARQHGIKVLLSGAGGDDIFTGYRRHYALMQERYWSWLPKSVRRQLSSITQSLPTGSALGRRISKGFRYAALDGDERLVSYFYWLDPQTQKNLYSSNLKEQIAKFSASTPLLESLSNLPNSVHPLNRMLYLEGKHFLADHNLNYTDKMSMAAGVEVRVPLLDPDLVALAARLPIQYKQRGREGKWIFKKAMEPYLPDDVIYRPKTGFGVPLRGWLRNQLKPLVNDTLSEASLKKRDLFDFTAVQNLREMDKVGRVDGTYTIFALTCIELWCRIFLD